MGADGRDGGAGVGVEPFGRAVAGVCPLGIGCSG